MGSIIRVVIYAIGRGKTLSGWLVEAEDITVINLGETMKVNQTEEKKEGHRLKSENISISLNHKSKTGECTVEIQPRRVRVFG